VPGEGMKPKLLDSEVVLPQRLKVDIVFLRFRHYFLLSCDGAITRDRELRGRARLTGNHNVTKSP
jgi:hypothetical protein